jgi:hypothetical protein
VKLDYWEKSQLLDMLTDKLEGLRTMVELDQGARDIWLDELSRTQALLQKVREETV